MRHLYVALLCAVLLPAAPALGGDRYVDLAVMDLEITGGALPADSELMGKRFSWRPLADPRVVLDGPGLGLLATPGFPAGSMAWRYERTGSRLFVRAPGEGDITGRLVLHGAAGDAPRMVSFRIPAGAASDAARDPVLRAEEAWYDHLAAEPGPGGAWFHHRARELRRERLGDAADDHPKEREMLVRRKDDLEDTLRLFSGGRAVAENLQMERILRPAPMDGDTVPVADLEGITVEEVDWAPLIEGKTPLKDPLSGAVPGDQYAIFFPDLRDLIRLVDEARRAGAPVLSWLEARSWDARTWQRYQAQLCLSLEGLNRFLGPLLARSVVVTGSDPFLRTGSDVAVILETDHDGLFLYLALRHYAARVANPDVRFEFGVRGRQVFYGLETPDRRISSWVMRIPDLGLVVANSKIQIEAIAAVLAGDRPPLADAPEYLFFRDRYPLPDPGETALGVVPDAALRAWAGPRSRILTSRRIRVTAALTMLQARHLDALRSGTLPLGALDAAVAVPGAGGFVVEDGPAGRRIRSEVYGTLDFLTPLAELPLEVVTRAEADAYANFRNRYQSNWRQYFDPIGLRLGVAARALDVDLSIFPLIRNSEYRELIELTAGATMAPDAGDPHAEALLRYGMSIDRSSSLFREVGSLATSVLPGVKGGALSWLGDSLVFYVDDGPFWDELAAAADPGAFIEPNLHRIPVALQVGVSGALEAAAFLASLRGFVEQTAPGLLAWENKTHAGRTWVRIGAAKPEADGVPRNLGLHYAVDGKRLLITLDEELMRRALARDAGDDGAPWLGRQAGIQLDGKVLDFLDRYEGGRANRHVVQAAWASIPILNEWHRLYPAEDPVAVHEAAWGVRLSDPAGGGYVWDPEWKTMASENYGHPAAPVAGPGLRRGPLARVIDANLGLTFELGGLRARAHIVRTLP
jgi:hypothetical protein